MEEQNRRNTGARNTIGAILILLGCLFLLHNLDIIDYNIPHIIFSGPFILFVIGMLIIINSRKKILGSVLALIGVVLLLERIFPYLDIDGGVIVSIIVIGLGLYILLRQHRSGPVQVTQEYDSSGRCRGRSDYSINKDYIDDVAIFGGGERIVFSDEFKGGSITAIFGGSEINLLNCKLAEGTNTIDVLALFGGAEIRVPRDGNVIVNATPIFGGFSNKIIRDPGLPVDITRTLVIKGLAMFGGIEVNSKPNYKNV